MYSDIYNRSIKRNGPEGGCMFNMGRFLQNIVNSHFIGSISAFIPHKYEINNRSPAPAPLPPKKYFKTLAQNLVFNPDKCPVSKKPSPLDPSFSAGMSPVLSDLGP